MTIYFNDRNEKTSSVVNVSDIPEIAGISIEDFERDYSSDIENLNEDMMMISFTYEPEFLSKPES